MMFKIYFMKIKQLFKKFKHTRIDTRRHGARGTMTLLAPPHFFYKVSNES